GQAGGGAAQAARGGPDLPLRVQLRAAPDADPWDGGTTLRDPAGAAGEEVRGACGAGAAQGGVPRDAQGEGGGAGEAQEAERGAGPVWRLLGAAGAPAAGGRLRVRGQHRG